jgi:hypothetical protein
MRNTWPFILICILSSSVSVRPAGSQQIQTITVGNEQPVLAPASASPCAPAPAACSNNPSINCYGGLASLADEHSTVLPPGTLPGHGDYLFFVPTKTCLNGGSTAQTGDTSGLVVLTGGAGPDTRGQWTLDFPPDFDFYDETIDGQRVQGDGQIFLSPMNRTFCPAVRNAKNQDPTFDLNYANPGSIVVDRTSRGPGKLLMIYEGTNRCVGFTTMQDDNFYSTLGIATSLDNGHTWASYRENLTPLPQQSASAGPDAPLGALGPDVCMGNDCTTPAPAGYGRYAVLGAPIALSTLIETGGPLPTKSMGDSEPSAFVDDVHGAADAFLYTVENFGTGGHAYPGTESGTISVARARLGGSAPLEFSKWYGPSVAYGSASSGSFELTSITVTGTDCGPGSTSETRCQISNQGLASDGGGLESPLFPQDPSNSPESYATCQANAQIQLGAAISYVDETQQYLLTFICNSPFDPADPNAPSPDPQHITRGAAWFYATLDARQSDLSHQERWSAPVEVGGSWGWLTSNGLGSNCVYSGWYPTFMSLGKRLGHLSMTGYVFSMNGCQDTGAGGPREYTSRAFIISTAPGTSHP